MLAITFRDLAYRKRQFLIAVIGSGFMFALALDLTGMSQGFRSEANRTVTGVGADAWFVGPGVEGPFTSISVLPASAAERVAAAPGVRQVDPLVIFPTTLGTGNNVRGVNLIGYQPGALGAPPIASGRSIAGPGQVVTNDSLGFHPGDHIVISGRPFDVVGTAANRTYFAGVPVVFVALEDGQKLAFGGQPLASVLVTRGTPTQSVAGLQQLTNDDVRRDLLRPMVNPTKTIDNTRVFMWLVAALIVGAVTYLSTLERLRDFAVLKAVGGSSRSLVATVCLQSVIASLCAATLAGVLANLLRPAFEIPLDITLSAYLALPVVGVVIGALSSVVALRRAVRVDPALAFAS